ncbi:MAG: low affinity iron permease family protein [Acidobacteria bacterium]|nr:low affinity iron permease family protein [Acidobacteriota bacterium]
MREKNYFERFATSVARTAGHAQVFVVALGLIAVWSVTGPVFGFSDTWQLVINTSTTIVTFLMVFVIQNTQNRETEAMHIKLDELIRAIEGAHNALLDLEELNEQDLDRIRFRYEKLARDARDSLRRGEKDTGITEVDSA